MPLNSFADLAALPKRQITYTGSATLGSMSASQSCGMYSVVPSVFGSVAASPVDGAIVTSCLGEIPLEADARCINAYATHGSTSSNIPYIGLLDLLWMSGELTGTGPHAIVTPTLPARANGGNGYLVGVMGSDVVDATQYTVTFTYTNSAGSGGRSASIGTGSVTRGIVAAATPVTGGDVGVRSVESVSISPTTGTVKFRMVLFRRILRVPNIGNSANPIGNAVPGVNGLRDARLTTFGTLGLNSGIIPAGTVLAPYGVCVSSNNFPLAYSFTFAMDM